MFQNRSKITPQTASEQASKGYIAKPPLVIMCQMLIGVRSLRVTLKLRRGLPATAPSRGGFQFKLARAKTLDPGLQFLKIRSALGAIRIATVARAT